MPIKSCKDYRGTSYPSIQAMCDAHGVRLGTYETRKRAGKSLKECLTPTPVYTDAAGNEYSSLSALSRASGIPYGTLRHRMQKGLSIEQCLKHTEKQEKMETRKKEAVKDHLGNEFPSVSAMCLHYGVGRSTYNARIQNGWTLEEALTRETRVLSRIQTDHKGNTYPSQNAMCRAYDIQPETFLYRIKNGWSVEEALTVPLYQQPEHTEEPDYE